MKFAAAALFIGAAAAWGSNGTWSEVVVTDVVTSFTTYCPEATTFTHGESTYTVTEATTLTITNCPCTLTRTTSTLCPTPPPPPPKSSSSAAPYTWHNTTITTKPAGTGSATTSAGAQFTGAANHLGAAGAGVAAVAGLVAALL